MTSVIFLQADQLMFALHFVRGMHPELFQENVS
jgi:dynein heavy chain 2